MHVVNRYSTCTHIRLIDRGKVPSVPERLSQRTVTQRIFDRSGQHLIV